MIHPAHIELDEHAHPERVDIDQNGLVHFSCRGADQLPPILPIDYDPLRALRIVYKHWRGSLTTGATNFSGQAPWRGLPMHHIHPQGPRAQGEQDQARKPRGPGARHSIKTGTKPPPYHWPGRQPEPTAQAK